MQETQEMLVQSLGGEDPLEEGMAGHSSILAWSVPWTEEPGGLQCVWLHRFGNNWSDLAHMLARINEYLGCGGSGIRFRLLLWGQRLESSYCKGGHLELWPSMLNLSEPLTCLGHRHLQGPGSVEHNLCLFWRSSSFSSVQFSCSVVSDSLRPHESQHARPPCPSPTPGVQPNPFPLNWWCHPTISSSSTPFFFCPQSIPS